MLSIEIQTLRGMRNIGQGQPVFVVAELSGNHLQDFARAENLVLAAAEAGADAVKLQTYTADTITLNSDKEWFRVGGKDNPKDWQGQTLYQLYQEANTPWEWHGKLQKLAESLGLVFFSTPFDETAVDFLEDLQPPVYKIASYEVTHIPLLKKVAKTGKPVIMSIGFASLEEIEFAVKTMRENGVDEIALLHCLTSYGEAPGLEKSYLGNIQDLMKRFDIVAGFSDNNGGVELPVTAVRAGAAIIEKHLTLSRADGGPDAQFSLEPAELAEMVKQIRIAEREPKQIDSGTIHYGPVNEKEKYNKRFRRSIFVVRDIKKGEKFTQQNIRVIRPEFGIPPRFFEDILGKKAVRDIELAEPLSWQDIERKIEFRFVEKSDVERVWEIRNHPKARANSFNNDPIPFFSHQQWFEDQYFTNRNNYCLVLVIEGLVVGYCRFDLKEPRLYRNSIALDPQFHGQGLGKKLLEEGLRRLPLNSTVFAEVEKDNIASLKLFQKMEFRTINEDAKFKYLEYVVT